MLHGVLLDGDVGWQALVVKGGVETPSPQALPHVGTSSRALQNHRQGAIQPLLDHLQPQGPCLPKQLTLS